MIGCNEVWLYRALCMAGFPSYKNFHSMSIAIKDLTLKSALTHPLLPSHRDKRLQIICIFCMQFCGIKFCNYMISEQQTGYLFTYLSIVDFIVAGSWHNGTEFIRLPIHPSLLPNIVMVITLISLLAFLDILNSVDCTFTYILLFSPLSLVSD